MSIKYPYTDFHEMNLDWTLETVKKAENQSSDAVEKADQAINQSTATEEYVQEYFENLDVQDEIDNAIDALVSDGTMTSIINPVVLSALPPVIVDTVDEMTNTDKIYILSTNAHVYQYSNSAWTDTGIVYGGSIGNVVTYSGVLSASDDLNNLAPNTVYLADESAIPTNTPISAAGFVETIGQQAGARMQQFTVFSTGIIYYRRYSSGTWGAWRHQNILFAGTLASTDDLNSIDTQTIYFISANAIPVNSPTSVAAFVYTYGVVGGVTQQFVKELHTAKAYYRRRVTTYGAWMDGNGNSLQYIGSASSTATPLPDLNDAPGMSLYVCNSNAGLLNMPVNETGYLYTSGLTGNARTQLFITYNTGAIYYRHSTSNTSNTYTDWMNILSQADGNPNAHMLSIGNSILTGSVYINGAMDHLSAYHNAPYSVVADAINIPKNNVTHELYSSTGLVYNAGSGSFLDIIKTKDLSGYDVLLTHLYSSDMGTALGTVNSSAGDGTIAGAVRELVNYVRSSNGNCQVILVGIPPTSTTNYGPAVFTGTFGNEKSIADCDNVIKSIAAEMHFTFISWQDMALSYYYHDFTDGMNVHANNEATYRSMGAYLGGRASAQVNF